MAALIVEQSDTKAWRLEEVAGPAGVSRDKYLAPVVGQAASNDTIANGNHSRLTTQSAFGATLLTTAKEFDHLDGVFLNRVYLDPNPPLT